MNVFTLLHLNICAYRAEKGKRFCTVVTDLDDRIAPFAVDRVIWYNSVANAVLQQKRYPVCQVTADGKLRRCRTNLPQGMEITKRTIERLQKKIREKETAMRRQQDRLMEERFQYQASQAPHLVQLCNNRENQLQESFDREMKLLSDAIVDAITVQLETLDDAENLLSMRLNQCMDQIHLFCTKIPAHTAGETIDIPTIADLQAIKTLQTFPSEYTDYGRELKKLAEHYI